MAATSNVHSVRLAPDLGSRLQAVAERKGQNFSDVMRDAALAYLGECPTCGQPVPAPQRGAGGEP